MLESNEALFATKNSLIFDEIGRGTATFDGMAQVPLSNISIDSQISSHYHEITSLSNKYDLITNLHEKL